jgi:PPE-repeat protein
VLGKWKIAKQKKSIFLSFSRILENNWNNKDIQFGKFGLNDFNNGIYFVLVLCIILDLN